MKPDLKPEGAMGKQAFEALEFLVSARDEEDLSWGGQMVDAIIAHAEKMNPNDRLKLHQTLAYYAATATVQNRLDMLRKKILTRAYKRLSVFCQR